MQDAGADWWQESMASPIIKAINLTTCHLEFILRYDTKVDPSETADNL